MFGLKIRELRKRGRKTQDDIADALDVHKTTVSRWERTGDVPVERLEDLADALGVTVDELEALREVDSKSAISLETPEYVRNIDDALAWWTRISTMDLDIFARLIMGILATSEFMDRSTGIVAFTEDDLVKRGNLPVEVVERCLPLVLESPWIERLGNAKYAVKLKMPPLDPASEK